MGLAKAKLEKKREQHALAPPVASALPCGNFLLFTLDR